MNGKHTLFFNPVLTRSHPAHSHKVKVDQMTVTLREVIQEDLPTFLNSLAASRAFPSSRWLIMCLVRPTRELS
jgi:predicted component of type VI protein secretion system